MGRMDFTRHFNCSQMFGFFIWDHNGEWEWWSCLWKSMEIFSCYIDVNGTYGGGTFIAQYNFKKKMLLIVDKHHDLVAF